MFPIVDKLASEIGKAIEKPGQVLVEKALTEGAKAAGETIKDRMKSRIDVLQKVSDFKERSITNSEDIAYVCALIDILYCSILEIRINGKSLRSATPNNDSFPAAFIFFGKPAVEAAENDLHQTVARLRLAKTCFADIFPACVSAITAKEYVDLKSLASKFSSMMIADAILFKDAIETCQNGVEVCSKGLSWASAYDKTLEQWLEASKSKNTK